MTDNLRAAAQAVVNNVFEDGADPFLHIDEELIDALRAALAEPAWIPVAERLPEDGSYYIIAYMDEGNTGPYVDIGWYGVVSDSWEYDRDVRYWRPLPEPPA